MNREDRHVPGDLMDRYRTGRLEPAVVMSVEAHLTRCARCRAAVPYEEEWPAAGWERLEEEVDRPRPGPVERLLSRAGVPGHLARLLVATPALSRAWVVAVVVVLACAVAVGQATRDVGASYLLAFLVAAPVLPLAGIAPAYGRHVDPVHETQAATPMAGPRLLLLRAGAVLATAVVLTAAASPWLPGPPGRGAGWLLPSLALSVGFAAAGRHRAGGRGVRAGGTRRGGSRGTARRRAADRAGRERVAGRAAGGLAVPYR
ncbi:zf-HC2 domain-containing protein [Nonomuraea sp. KM90]|uniref:zf-HC2 domain-containing protein n=1 Tax=Nonomuraea sp. KM90 TaxID=3457428 RepID=UPI003FCCEB5A